MKPELWQEVETLFSAVLDLPQNEWDHFIVSATQNRPDVRNEVESLLRAHSEAGHFLADCSPSSSGSWIGRRIGPYRILKEIGRGGMAMVFMAEREDQFRKKVAIKIIGAGPLNAELASRFLHERQILATLEHPNIARLLDGGATNEGTPYMVMEYVEGVPITEYVETHRLGLHGRLTMFQTACLAVHYAHQRLVVHRDIKPGNILVTPDGTPILLDFGIAKMLNPLTATTSATHAFLQPITPDYASPEQLRGEPATTATDVYSLGVLLYELLAGQRPHSLAEATLLEAIRIKNSNQPLKPSVCREDKNLDIGSDLDSIVLKAIRAEPGERYASAQEFADDVGRYVHGQPVTARARSAGYVVRKWIGRHRVAFALTIAALVVLVTGVTMIAWEAHVANLQRLKAQKRFDELHSLARSVIFELHDGIAKLAGSTEVRKTLVTRALAYLDSLTKDAAGDTNLQFELAAAYRRIGDVQGNWSVPNLGDTKGALASYRKGLELVETARTREPQSRALLLQAARLNFGIGEIYLGTRNASQAQKFTRAGLTLLRSGGVEPLDLAGGLLDMYLAMQITDRSAARPFLDEAAQLYEAQLPTHPAAAHDVALAHRYLATYGNPDSAIRDLKRALELDEQLLKVNPSDAQAREAVSLDVMEMGHRLMDRYEPSEALKYYRRGLAVRQELAQADARNVLATARVGFAHLAVARALVALKDNAGAFDSASRSVSIYLSLTSSHANDFQSWYWLAEAYSMIGGSGIKLGRREQACEALHRGLDAYAVVTKIQAPDFYLRQVKTELNKDLKRCSSR